MRVIMLTAYTCNHAPVQEAVCGSAKSPASYYKSVAGKGEDEMTVRHLIMTTQCVRMLTTVRQHTTQCISRLPRADRTGHS